MTTPAASRPLPAEQRHLGALAPRLVSMAAAVGVIGIVVSVVLGWREGWAAFFRSYIINYIYVLSFALGALFFVLMQHLSRAGWAVVVRRPAECIAATMPVLAVLFVPILIPVVTGMTGVYPWTEPDAAHDPALVWKHAYLNVPFFIVRCAAYFAIWTILALYYYRRSVQQDATGDAQTTLRMGRLSGVGMVLYGVTVTLFAFDVIKSLAPHWFSTIFGVYYFAGSMVGFFALLGLIVEFLQRSGRLTRSITIEHYHDVGKFVFGWIVFWAYIAYSQYMLMWYANIPEETIWYYVRQAAPWWVGVSLVLLAGHFVVPFLALISRIPKRRKGALAIAAVWVLLVHWIDMYYLVGPRVTHAGESVHVESTTLHATDVSLLAGLGGLLAAAIVWRMSRQALLPERDPRLTESLAFENI